MTTVGGFALYGPKAASHRVRLAQFQPGLAAAGIQLQIQSLLDDAYLRKSFVGERPSWGRLLEAYARRIRALRRIDRNEVAIVYAELLPLLPFWFEQQLLRIPYILDIDDAFYLKYRSGRFGWMRPFLGGKIDRLMTGAAAIAAGNRHLADYARSFNARVTLLPSVVDTDVLRPAPPDSSSGSGSVFTVGWIGSPSTAPYLELLVEPLRQLAMESPVRLLVVGGRAPVIPGVEVIEQAWSLEQEPALIQQFDVGVMPLPDTPWTRGKCAYKLIQCMACALPVVASPVGANVDVVPPDCGILAATPQQWFAAFRRLAADPCLRQSMGSAARRWVEASYSLQSSIPTLISIILCSARR